MGAVLLGNYWYPQRHCAKSGRHCFRNREIFWTALQSANGRTVLHLHFHDLDAMEHARWSFDQRCHGYHLLWRSLCRGSRPRSEEHTSELQSRFDLVCRLLLEKKKQERERRRALK